MTLTVDCQVAQKSQHFFSRPGCDDPQQGYLPVGNNVPGYQVETRPSTLCTPIIESFQLVAQLVDNIDVRKKFIIRELRVLVLSIAPEYAVMSKTVLPGPCFLSKL